MVLATVLAWAAPSLAAAAPVAVTTGEHEGFTRITLDFGREVDWQLGRTEDGYALRIAGAAAEYDLSAAFQAIDRARLASVASDPETGDLVLTLGCPCHAIPFAFRPSIVVIDIKPGPPPAKSAFEVPLPAWQAAASPLKPQARPVTVPGAAALPAAAGPRYDWVAARQSAASPPVAGKEAAAPTPLAVAGDLEPLRKILIEQMSRGAAAGLIELSLPRDTTEGMVPGFPATTINLGDRPNLTTYLGEDSGETRTGLGEVCLSDADLALADWALNAGPVSDQMGPAMAGLVGEFDKPDPKALTRAVRFHLYLGFGAEALALIRAFPSELAQVPAWQSMARILDGLPDQAGAFRAMAGCDTAAALWAVLSVPNLKAEPRVNTKAVMRAFSALPAHLRLQLGPRVADQMLAIDDALAARSIRDAVTRIPGPKPPDVALLEAKLQVAEGDLSAATARLAPLTTEPGSASDLALAELVAATARDLRPVPLDQVEALAALVTERRDSAEARQFAAALVLGQAASGQFDLAIPGLAEYPELTESVWTLLSVLGTDAALLAEAVLPAETALPAAAAPAAAALADRLLALGFVADAARWLNLAPQPDPHLVARLALARGDGPGALAILAGLTDAAAQALKAEALAQTANHHAAADLYQALGQDQAYWRAEGLAQNWPVLAQGGPAPWADAASQLLVTPAPAAPATAEGPVPGPLAQARAIADTAEETRQAIDALLAAVPAPAPQTD